MPPIGGLDDTSYLTSTTAMELQELPGSMIVIDDNYIGPEMSQLFARLGSRVTRVEALDRIAPNDEPEISEVLSCVLRDEGLTLRTGANVNSVRRENGGIVATVALAGRSEELRGNQLLIARGRRANTSGLALDMVGVTVGRKGDVVVDEQLRTTNPRIWAAGDVTSLEAQRRGSWDASPATCTNTRAPKLAAGTKR